MITHRHLSKGFDHPLTASKSVKTVSVGALKVVFQSKYLHVFHHKCTHSGVINHEIHLNLTLDSAV